MLFSICGYSQVERRSGTSSTATATASATIISVEDTASYYNEQRIFAEQELINDTVNIQIGDTKTYLLKTFNPPDEKIILSNDKE